MKAVETLLLRALLAPADCAQHTELQWDLLIRQARAANLLAELGLRLREAGVDAQVPPPARLHLAAADKLVERQRIAIHWEVRCIQEAVGQRTDKLTLLKGAAYLMRGLPQARSRIFTDVDILVPREDIDAVEGGLLIAGWQVQELDAYNQRYYRQWMHEIPPLTHILRGTSIDVHHTILPATARIRVNTPELFAQLQPLGGHPGIFTLSDTDMLLHSATHLFHEGEFENGLRDLFDLDAMLRHFAQTPGFWEALVPRAQVLGLSRPLFYALRYTARLLGSRWPDAVMQAAQCGAPGALALAAVDACYERALCPVHASSADTGTGLARFALYLRSHWLRMPLHLLSLHLARKAWRRMLGLDVPDEPEQDQPQPR